MLSSLDKRDTRMPHAEQRGWSPVRKEPSIPPKIEDLWLLQIKVSPSENDALNFVSMVALYLLIETI